MVGREAWHTRLALCHLLREWCIGGQVSRRAMGDIYQI